MRLSNTVRSSAPRSAGTLFASAVAALAVAAPAEAAYPGANGKIAFGSDRHVAAGEIYTTTPGGAVERVTFSNKSSDPVYSPDGSRIAFVSTDNQIFVMDADGTGRRQITKTSTAKQEPTWSADGTQIAYVANSFDVGGQTDLEIWAINADGTGRTQLTSNTFPDTQPAWSPNGGRIAFVSARTGDTDRNIHVMNADGTNQTDVTPSSPPGCSPNCYQGHDDNPAWSPDGSRIAYVHGHTISGGGLPDIWTIGPLGGNRTNVSNDDSISNREPAWSPNGARIAFQGIAANNTNRNIYVMNANGTNPAPIVNHPAHDEKPDWQPIPVCTEFVNAANDPLLGTPGDDVLCGDPRDNTINGTGGDDVILPRGGDDSLRGAGGNDTLDGGPGEDLVLYSGPTAVRASLTTGFATGLGPDVLIAVESITGSSANDRLIGSGAANVLVGGGGPDALFGLGGSDILNSRDGISGNDIVNGGPATDQCITDPTEESIAACP